VGRRLSPRRITCPPLGLVPSNPNLIADTRVTWRFTAAPSDELSAQVDAGSSQIFAISNCSLLAGLCLFHDAAHHVRVRFAVALSVTPSNTLSSLPSFSRGSQQVSSFLSILIRYRLYSRPTDADGVTSSFKGSVDAGVAGLTAPAGGATIFKPRADRLQGVNTDPAGNSAFPRGKLICDGLHLPYAVIGVSGLYQMP